MVLRTGSGICQGPTPVEQPGVVYFWWIGVRRGSKVVLEAMSRRFAAASTRRRGGVGERAGVALTVYHASADVEHHVAALKGLRRFRVTCVQQRKISTRGPVRAADVVLWELVAGKQPSRRRVASLAKRGPLVSYSVNSSRQLIELSRSLGCLAHLRAPISPSCCPIRPATAPQRPASVFASKSQRTHFWPATGSTSG